MKTNKILFIALFLLAFGASFAQAAPTTPLNDKSDTSADTGKQSNTTTLEQTIDKGLQSSTVTPEARPIDAPATVDSITSHPPYLPGKLTIKCPAGYRCQKGSGLKYNCVYDAARAGREQICYKTPDTVI